MSQNVLKLTTSGLVRELEKIERDKEKLRLKEKLVKLKEQKKRAKEFIEIGRIASRVDIDRLDCDVLLGAFIEISQRSQDPEVRAIWKQNAATFSKESASEVSRSPLSVKFVADAPQDAVKKLKAVGFRWNRFRKEFLGYGNQTDIQNLLAGLQLTIEVLR